jgi:DNA-directed RNA polymerase subunit RPC12/RpoP
MAGELITGLGAFKTLLDSAKGLTDISDAATRNAAVIEHQEKIIAAQIAQATLIERVRELEEQVAKLEEWNAEKKKYELRALAPGVFAYALKEEARGTTPMHCLCTRCYEHGRKSILQREREWDFGEELKCHECGSRLTVEEKPIYMRNPWHEVPDDDNPAV